MKTKLFTHIFVKKYLSEKILNEWFYICFCCYWGGGENVLRQNHYELTHDSDDNTNDVER